MTQLSQINEDYQQTLECLYNYAQGFKSRHVMLMVGGSEKSFMYAEAHFNFLERVMSLMHGKKMTSKNVTVKFRYSNFDTYFKEASKAGALNTYEGDFSTYTGVEDSEEYYATGIYSQRPLLK